MKMTFIRLTVVRAVLLGSALSLIAVYILLPSRGKPVRQVCGITSSPTNSLLIREFTNVLAVSSSLQRYEFRRVNGYPLNVEKSHSEQCNVSSARTTQQAIRTQDVASAKLRTSPGTRGRLDPRTSCRFLGKIMKHEDALPMIREYLWSEDKSKIIEAVIALRTFGPKIGQTAIVDRMLALYDVTESPYEVVDERLTRDEGLNLDMKLWILSAVFNSCDPRVEPLLDKAVGDRNATIVRVATMLRKGLQEGKQAMRDGRRPE